MFHVAVTVAVGNLKKGCRLSRFHFNCCHYFLGHVAFRNLPWKSLNNDTNTGHKWNKRNLSLLCVTEIVTRFEGQKFKLTTSRICMPPENEFTMKRITLDNIMD